MKIKYTMVILTAVTLLGCAKAEEPVQLDEPDLLMAGPVVVEDDINSGAGTGIGTEDDFSGNGVEQTGQTIMVFVCGEVNSPGVYEMESDARVCDAILRAGDFADEADTDYLNLAEGLSDGQRLYVPSEEETAMNAAVYSQPSKNQGTGGISSNSSGLININTASVTELKTLPGIGDVKAGAIVQYRENHGNFGSIEDIKQVDGIKSGLYDSIKDKITVN